MFVIWCVASALAWDHGEIVAPNPMVLELTTVDAAQAPPGAVQDAVRRAVDLWTDDACLETLDLSVVDTDDNLVAVDGRNLVAVNHELAFGDAALFDTAETVVFTRFGNEYRELSDVDIAFGDELWAVADEVATGTCVGPALDLTVTRMVGYALGLARGTDTAEDSVFEQAVCTEPVLSEDDRAGLRALYGSGIDVSCDPALAGLTFYTFATLSLEGAVDDCIVETYGASPLVETTWIVDGETSYTDLGDAVLDVPGRHTIEVCATFDVAPGCDQPTTCVPIDRGLLVCTPLEPVIEASITDDGLLLLTDLTALVDPICGASREWTVTDALGVLDTEAATATDPKIEAEIQLFAPGEVEVTLSVGVNDDLYTVTETFVWEGDGSEEPDDTDVPDDGDDEEPTDTDEKGCGCATIDSSSAGLVAMVALLGLRRRRVR